MGDTQKDGVRKRNIKEMGEIFILFYFCVITSEIKGYSNIPVSYLMEHKKIFLMYVPGGKTILL